MEGVVKREWGSLSVHSYDFTFFRIKTHQPVLFSHLKVIQICLQLETAIMGVDCQVQDSIVCKQVDGGLNILREVVNVDGGKSRYMEINHCLTEYSLTGPWCSFHAF